MKKLLKLGELPILVGAGIVGQKVAAAIWARALGEPPPDTAQEDVRWPLLLPAAILEGTLYKLFRMVAERGLRIAVARSTGSWIGRAGEGE